MSASDDILAPGFVERPFWWDAAPPVPTPGEAALPDEAEVLVIGGGITGLSTALELGRHRRRALVLDREMIGWGASSRNGGALSGAGSLGRARADLQGAIGPEILGAMLDEAEASFEDYEELVRREGIDCQYRRCGRFVGAHGPAAMETLRRRADMLNRRDPAEAEIVPRARLEEELATERYHGGLVIRRAGSVHPGKYVRGLATAAERHGATLCGGVSVESYARDGDGFRVATSRGEVRARALMVATNGYTGGATPWHRRRLVPAASYMIATEPLGAERVQALLPKLRVYGDTKKVLYYFRPSPDGDRILFGGRASFVDADVRRSGMRLHRFLTRLLPDLAGTRITHSWKGNVAFAIDMMPHVGQQDGVHFALGCNGSGVVTMTHLGRQSAHQMLGTTNRASAFSRMPFPTMPLYNGVPWFLPAVGAYFQWRDRRDGWRQP